MDRALRGHGGDFRRELVLGLVWAKGWLQCAALPSLREQLAAPIAHCVRDDVAVAVTVETTLDEIVDVTASVSPRAGKRVPLDAGAIASCIEDAVWNTNVRMAAGREHETTQIAY